MKIHLNLVFFEFNLELDWKAITPVCVTALLIELVKMM